MSLSVVASLTDVGRQRLAQQLITGKSFIVNAFSVNSAGHDPSNPMNALTPDTSAVSCPGGAPLYGPVSINSSTLINSFCPQYECILPQTAAVGAISNICLFGQIVYSPTPNDPDLGTQFLFGIGNFPMKVKVSSDALKLIVSVQF